MENTINAAAIEKLIAASKEDSELLGFIHTALKSFSDYHAAVTADQLYPLVYAGGGADGEEFRKERAALDKRRTIAHNAVIANVNLLNRMAKAAGTEPIYDGVVSEERPHRRTVANAVFEYLKYLIDRRS